MGDAMKADGAFIGQDVSVTPLIGKLRLHIQGYVDKEDFFISPLKHEDVILGAPWFDRLAASIKLPERRISFKFREKNMYIDAQESGNTIPLVHTHAFDKSIKSSISVYMIFVKDFLSDVNKTQVNESGSKEDLELSKFLNQFQDVFIDDIPGELPPKRGDDDHAIELIPEMPGIPMKAETSIPSSKKQDHMASTPASEKHMVAGRRKLEEYRKKKKNKAAAEKAVSSNMHLEGLANGPNFGPITEGNSGQGGVNGHDAQPVSDDRKESLFQGAQLEEASGGETHAITNITNDSLQGVPSLSGYVPTTAAIVSSQSMGDLVVELQESDPDASVLRLASFTKNEMVDIKREELHPQHRFSGVSNGRRSWDLRETQSSFMQPKKLLVSERTEREPLFSSKLLDKSLFQPSPVNRIASQTVPSPLVKWEGPSLSLSASEQSTADTIPDKEKESEAQNQQEETQRHAENDDFAALEQHIDDLTQEKFALQRALEAARSLADSLSQQNSALTEDFNSQAAIINQLQEGLEKKNEEVTAQSLVLSSLMMERERAQQENNSAVERSQILAGEVIGLEEKVLRLRSSELKLQKELENLKADNDSFRVQLATLDKDRQNLRTVIEALQEDKKLMQSQLQKALAGGDSLNAARLKEGSQSDLRDASTSTEDLVNQIQNTPTLLSMAQTRVDAGEPASSSMAVSVPDSLGVSLPSTFATLSAEDFRAIDSIDKLITELSMEKEALVDLLRRESAKATEFEALSIELSKKLETQTQRFELAVAQNMAYGGNAVTANSIEIESRENDYVDEGDEVVERVLGWIMRIFPGGSSRRQSSKLL
ncbi:hypothetical protein L7F22_014490 [Adiantum nelumboides]|nr:hypothetical protein [Adiantum nelumboides]